MATSKIQSVISSGMDNIKSVQKNLSQMPTNVANQVTAFKDNTQKNMLNSINWAKGNLNIYHYGILIIIIAIVIYKVHSTARYNRINPTLYPSPSNAREEESPMQSKFSSLEQKKEYSYTIWMYVDNMDYNFNKYKHVFTRGNTTDFKLVNGKIEDGDNTIEQIAVPGIWIDKIKNNLIFKMSTVKEDNLKELIQPGPAPGTPISERLIDDNVCVLTPQNTSKVEVISLERDESNNETCSFAQSQPSWGCDAFMIEDFPLKEWFCVGVVVKDREVDLFFNGDLTYTGSLRGPPKECINEVKIAGIGHDPNKSTSGGPGWAGSYRNIGMYTYPLSAIEMKKIYYNGPQNREYYLKWFYYLADPIINIVSRKKRKDIALLSSYLKESETDIMKMEPDEAIKAREFNNTLKEKAEGLFKKGERVFYLAKGSEEKLAAYISDGPNLDDTSPDTGELTYEIILEKHTYGNSNINTNNTISDVLQSRLSKDVKSKSYYGLALSIIVICLLIGVIVYYKIY